MPRKRVKDMTPEEKEKHKREKEEQKKKDEAHQFIREQIREMDKIKQDLLAVKEAVEKVSDMEKAREADSDRGSRPSIFYSLKQFAAKLDEIKAASQDIIKEIEKRE
jgi:uncharacterized membrane protein YdfJ with MMPL/SSD domain